MTPTKRQIEAMRSIYLGRSIYDRRDRSDLGRSYSSAMGGAVRLMRDRMGEAGWLQEHGTVMGRTYYRDKLTSAGLMMLRDHSRNREGLDDIDAAIVAAREAESEARIEAEAKRQSEKTEMVQRAAKRRIDRIAAMREIAQSYQISLDRLSDDQVLAMWQEIIEREHKL